MSTKFDCKKAFLREIKFMGNGGQINCNYYWAHVILSLKNQPKFLDGRAELFEITEINFNGDLFAYGGERWEDLDDKMDRKVQKIFDSIVQMGNQDSNDGRDRCISQSVIDKLKKIGFVLTSDHFYIDKNFKDAFTGNVVAEVTELN